MDERQQIEQFLRRRHFHQVLPIAALIDMDGTLYDSMGNHADAWMKMAEEEHLPARREEFFIWEGQTGAMTINTLFRRTHGRDATEEEIRELYHRKTIYFQQLPPVSPMEGAQDMVATFIKSGVRRVLVTGSGQSSLINRIEADFPGAFTPELMVTSRDVEHGKPHPEPFIRAMQKAGVKPSQAIAIENAPLGVKSAVAAGVFTVGVVTGPIPVSDMEDAGAAIVYRSMREFADALPQLLLNLLTTAMP
ncbi:MAG: HAD-IA family hydrolase [Muribaculaceae bacterium]|nr:HAD-IA family hydrolase [Muribaculaceae bacterium]